MRLDPADFRELRLDLFEAVTAGSAIVPGCATSTLLMGRYLQAVEAHRAVRIGEEHGAGETCEPSLTLHARAHRIWRKFIRAGIGLLNAGRRPGLRLPLRRLHS